MGPGHMTEMALKIFSGTGGPISMNLVMLHRGLMPITVCINHDLGLTLTYFYGKVKFGHIGFLMNKGKIYYVYIFFSGKFCSL